MICVSISRGFLQYLQNILNCIHLCKKISVPIYGLLSYIELVYYLVYSILGNYFPDLASITSVVYYWWVADTIQ